MRISKTGAQNADELIDVQVTSPFCVEAAGLVGKAASIAESKKRTKYRPAVVTPAPCCKNPLCASHAFFISTTRASSPSAMAPSELHLPCPPVRAAPFPGSVPCACVFSPVDFFYPPWPPGVAILAPHWLDTFFPVCLYCVVLWLARPSM